MKKYFSIILMFALSFFSAQSKKVPIKKQTKKVVSKPILEKINPNIPDLIPQRKDEKLGYVNQKGMVIIPHQFKFGTFFYEDCNLLNSPYKNLQKFGTNNYASVTVNDKDYRIDKSGKKVYTFKKEDLGSCNRVYQERKYFAYVNQGFYGLVNQETFQNPKDYHQYQIYPQYQYLFVLEGDDLDNPMLIVSQNDRFGIIDKHGNIIIPLEYADIKRNYSWKMAHMFEVTKDNKNYYFIDQDNKQY